MPKNGPALAQSSDPSQDSPTPTTIASRSHALRTMIFAPAWLRPIVPTSPLSFIVRAQPDCIVLGEVVQGLPVEKAQIVVRCQGASVSALGAQVRGAHQLGQDERQALDVLLPRWLSGLHIGSQGADDSFYGIQQGLALLFVHSHFAVRFRVPR